MSRVEYTSSNEQFKQFYKVMLLKINKCGELCDFNHSVKALMSNSIPQQFGACRVDNFGRIFPNN